MVGARTANRWIRLSVPFFLLFFFGCAGTRPIADYVPKNEDEESIARTIEAYQNTVNASRWNDIPGFFTTDGRIDGVPVREWLTVNQRDLDSMKAHNCRVKFFSPEDFSIVENGADVRLMRNLRCDSGYNQASRLRFRLSKQSEWWKIQSLDRMPQ